MPGKRSMPIEARFWRAVVKTELPILEGRGPCWLYGGKGYGNKYGVISKGVGLGNTTAHRFSYELHKGEIPRGKFVCHRCDVRNCVNPDHLYAGDHEDNNRDSRERGLFVGAPVRNARVKTKPGEGSHGRKLGREYIDRLLAEYAAGKFTQQQLAVRYGVSQGTVSATIRGVKNMGTGTYSKKRSGNFRRKFAPEVLQEIKALYATGKHTQTELAERFGCDQTYVSLIVRDK
jgi:transposase